MGGYEKCFKDAMKAAHAGAPETKRQDLPVPTRLRPAKFEERRTTLSVAASLAKRLKRCAVEEDKQVQELLADILDLELTKRGY